MTVREIVLAYLQANGFDGLFDDNECGCSVEDLMPCCDTTIEYCRAGYKVTCNCGDHDFHIGREPATSQMEVMDAAE